MHCTKGIHSKDFHPCKVTRGKWPWGNVVNCLCMPIHVLLNFTSYASTDLLHLLDQASLSVEAYEVIFNST